jgi:hypothetical protein
LIDLGSGYYEFWTYLEPIFLTEDGISLFGNTLPFDDVSEEIWRKVFIRLENKRNDEIRIRRYVHSRISNPRFELNIVSDFPAIFKEFENQTFRLLYRGTRDGFGASNFHAKCDEQSNTLVIILSTEGYIFGGFSPTAWDSTSSHKAYNTGKSFLFRLKNPRNSEPKIFPISEAGGIQFKFTVILHLVHVLVLLLIFMLQAIAIKTRRVTQVLDVTTRMTQELPRLKFSRDSSISKRKKLKFSQSVPKSASSHTVCISHRVA